jgi:hypothetical protein
VRIEKDHLYIYRMLGKRHLQAVLKGFLHVCGFLGGLPFLEEGGETVHIEGLSALRVKYPHLTVTTKRRLVEVLPASRPCARAISACEINGLVGDIPAKHIVQPERSIREMLFIGLRPEGKGAKESRKKADEEVSHTLCFLQR